MVVVFQIRTFVPVADNNKAYVENIDNFYV